VVAAAAAVIGYFQLLPGISGAFTRFGRAREHSTIPTSSAHSWCFRR
jgi:hypothetical protein